MFRRLLLVGLALTLILLTISPSLTLGQASAIPFNQSVRTGTIELQGRIDLRAGSEASRDNGMSWASSQRPSSIPGTGSLRQVADSVVQRDVSIQGNFTGLSLTNVVSTTGTIFTPPDVQIAAGPLDSMEMVNIVGEIVNKQGTSIRTFPLSELFMTGADHIGDPKVLFDAMSGRWFASIFDAPARSIIVAVSTTSHASGSFCVFTISTRPNFPDQPVIGVSDDKFVVSANDFMPGTTGAGAELLGAQFWILNKSELTACSTTVDFVSFGPDSTVSSVHPVQSLSSTTTQFMVSTTTNRTASHVLLYSVTGVPPGTVTSSKVALDVSQIATPPAAAQLGSGFKLDTADFRVQDAFWSNGMLWLAHDNACVPSGDTVTRACVHLVKIKTTTSTVTQDFNFGASGDYVFYPALRPDGLGNLLLIYGFSSRSDFPGLKVAEQATTDAVNTLETPVLLQAGLGPVELFFGCPVCRYGDYFGAGVDPSNPSIVWVAGEFGSGVTFGKNGGGWATEIGTITG